MKITGFYLRIDLKGTPDEDIEEISRECDSFGDHTTLTERRINLDISGNADKLNKVLEILERSTTK